MGLALRSSLRGRFDPGIDGNDEPGDTMLAQAGTRGGSGFMHRKGGT
jgi:hypothetical protein